MTSKYDRYVHVKYSFRGVPTYLVGLWDQKAAQYYWPISARAQRLSGASMAFSRTIAGFNGSFSYKTRKSALAAARRIYGPLVDAR